eukprot:s5588_g3.t1
MVRVELPQNATFYDCKQAISKLLGRDEILRKGRLVQKKGGVYSAFKDDDPLGDTRQVLVLGANLRKEEESDGEAMPPVHPYAEMKRPPQHIATEPGTAPGRPQPYAVKSRPQEELNVPPPRVSDFRDSMETPQTASQPVPARFEPQTRAEPKPKVVPKPKPPPPPPEEYEIRIKHAVEAGEVPLKIWTNWTFGAVRDALSKKLKRDDIQKKARFVFKAGTGTAPWIAFKDHEIVGWNPDGSRRNELMLLGVELVEPEREGPLSLELTQRLLEEFEKACGQEETQAALQKLLDRGGVALQLGLTQLMGQASQRAAEQLQLGQWKLQRLMDAVKAHGSDRSIQELSSRVEKTLRLDPGKLFGLRQASAVSSTASAIKGLLGRTQDEVEVDDDQPEEAGVRDLSIQEAVAMQRDLYAGFSDPGFQQRLDNLENFHRKDPKLILLRQELFLSVQSKVLPKYGFGGDLKGVFDMLEAFKKPEFQQNHDFMRLGSPGLKLRSGSVWCSSMRSRLLSRFSIGVILSGAAVLLQGCTDSCMDDGVVTVCCPSVFCKNDEGCCLKDPLNLCSGENGTGRLLEFVRSKQASGSSCLEERASDAMIENGKIKVVTTTVTTMTMTATRWP